MSAQVIYLWGGKYEHRIRIPEDPPKMRPGHSCKVYILPPPSELRASMTPKRRKPRRETP